MNNTENSENNEEVIKEQSVEGQQGAVNTSNELVIQTQSTEQVSPQIISQTENQDSNKEASSSDFKESAPVVSPPSESVSSNNETIVPATPSQPVVEVEKKPTDTSKKKVSNFRYFLVVLFFLGLAALVWFLPDIRRMMTEKTLVQKEELIDGTLSCVYADEDDTMSTEYREEFVVQNNLVKQYRSVVTAKGTEVNDVELQELNDTCEELTLYTQKLDGITSSCRLNSHIQTSRQEIDYSKVKEEELTAAYSEAGGRMPDYHLDDNAIDIKREMTNSGYECTVS